MQMIHIAGRAVGPGSPCFVIAEAGVNHNGSLDLALRLVDAAVDARADAVKFQTFTAERVVTRDAPKAQYQLETTPGGETQLEMLKKLELDEAAHREIQAHCARRGILFLSTPFDEQSADLLDRLDVPAFKVPSGEITNLPFLAHLARKGKPLVVSTGMSTLEEVRSAVAAIRASGAAPFALLHCVSAYPAQPRDANLKAMQVMESEFDVPVGFSDHTLGTEVALASVALGACVLEKHFTLDRTLPGPDHRASLEPAELATLVRGVRTVEAALGHGRKEPAAVEADVAAVSRKSLVSACRIPAGATLMREHIVLKNPGTGLQPSQMQEVVGRTAAADIPADTLLTWPMLK